MKKSKLYCKRIFLVLAIIGGVLLVWSAISMIYNPMRRPAPMIRSHILRHTPIGMDMEEVIEIIENNARWGSSVINRESGFRHPTPKASPWDYSERVGTLIVGEQSIQTRPARYNVILWHERNVRLFWGFDEYGKLIEVFVISSFSP